jgi:Tyrosyl-DNA phosphodiesterase
VTSNRLLLKDVIGSFAPGQGLRAALLLTYSFDGKWLEEGFVPDLFERPVATALILRDGNVILSEAPTLRYHRANAGFSRRVFHSKLALFVAEDSALVVVGSANLTRGGFERNLELANAFQVTQKGGPLPLFEGILRYIEGPLSKEVRDCSNGSPRYCCGT